MYYVLQLLDELEGKRRCSLIMAKELIVAAFGRPNLFSLNRGLVYTSSNYLSI
jgi:hypothetical protein